MWPCWRLVLDGVATLGEIERHYSFSDVLDANAYLDMRKDIERKYMELGMKGRGR